MSPRVFVLDNYDSFTFNLVQAFQVLGATVRVARNDEVTVEQVLASGATHLVISPGPGHPAEAGISVPLLQAALDRLPILGVCLGHQALALALGGAVVPARALCHGEPCAVHHEGEGLLAGLPRPFTAGRYHSLAVRAQDLPEALQVLARAPDGEVMAIAHRALPVTGLQFHPESVLTPDGPALLAAFLDQRARPALRRSA